ncbi:XdhC/CoxI family protein [Tissierella sp. Yu-01]|uniref:XdhC family protein n=1 Tax=Tissierella sp. Yu-01 TaxID=3035694 RepID=UPI00240D1992|nr:XdhC/CoxI family protein [Tissierella sp. Yu-01]WFA09993.1 XdhC family protein [Tissierella sp. Yu-01]
MFEKLYGELLEKLNEDSEVALLTSLSTKDLTINKKQVLSKTELDASIDIELKNNILESFDTGIPTTYNTDEESILIEPFFPKPRLIVFGGGHIAKPLTEFSRKVGFSVVVIDDRPFFANSGRFPDADEVICEDFNKVFDKIRLKSSDFVVIVTRGHKYDGVCLRNTLRYTTAYTGMIGSKRRVRAMMEELSKEGYDKEKLDKVCSPIGLDIGAVTPEEIAIAVIAQVISYRRASNSKLSRSKFNWPEFDMDVMKEAASKSEIPRALITIIGSKGSVPRKAGAKMIVWLDGRLIGTIGGGCSEANILSLARNVIQKKGYSIEHVDMTGDVAEDEGMVCGGVMDVLIESID